jgi:hypothetical protein
LLRRNKKDGAFCGALLSSSAASSSPPWDLILASISAFNFVFNLFFARKQTTEKDGNFLFEREEKEVSGSNPGWSPNIT